MKGAAIFKLANGYIIHSESRTTAGFDIASEPYLILVKDVTINKIVDKLMMTLKSSKKNVPVPKNWSEFNSTYFNAIGIKSNADLNKKSTKYCSVRQIEDIIQFTPSKHAAPPDKVFLHIPDEQVSVSALSSKETIADALAEAFSKCQ